MQKRVRSITADPFASGASRRIRTDDLLDHNQAL